MPFPSPEDLPNPGTESASFHGQAILYHSATGDVLDKEYWEKDKFVFSEVGGLFSFTLHYS